MFIEIIAALILGSFCGVFSGLTPGVHINLVSILLLSISPVLLQYTSPIVLAVFIMSMAVTHTFLDAIPSIFLGAPDSDTVMNVLPGHRMLMQGKGYEAVKLTVIGALLSLIVCIILLGLFVPIVPLMDKYLTGVMGWLLIAICAYMIFKEPSVQKKFWGTVIFLLGGVLGLIVLNFPNLNQPLLPMLSGLFGVSSLITSLSEKINIPEQSFTETVSVSKKDTAKAVAGATVSGSIAGLFPGMGPSQVAVMASEVMGDIGEYGFMILVGGINTVNMVVSLATLYALNKARNGAVLVIRELTQIDLQGLAILVLSSLAAGGFATFLTFKVTRVFSRMISKVDYKKLCLCIIALVVCLVMIFSGFFGLLVLIVSTALGLIPGMVGVKRSHSMGCLLVPVILYFVI